MRVVHFYQRHIDLGAITAIDDPVLVRGNGAIYGAHFLVHLRGHDEPMTFARGMSEADPYKTYREEQGAMLLSELRAIASELIARWSKGTHRPVW